MFPLGHIAAACGTAWLARGEVRRRAPTSLLAVVLNRIDYRAVAFGALLPDLIDKPLVWFVLRDEKYGGHHIAHSLIASSALMAVGLTVSEGPTSVFLTGFGAFTHVVYDSMSHVPWSLFYPLMKLDVPRNDMFLALTNVAGEATGLVALVYWLSRRDREHRVARFVLDGAIEG